MENVYPEEVVPYLKKARVHKLENQLVQIVVAHSHKDRVELHTAIRNELRGLDKEYLNETLDKEAFKVLKQKFAGMKGLQIKFK